MTQPIVFFGSISTPFIEKVITDSETFLIGKCMIHGLVFYKAWEKQVHTQGLGYLN